MLEVLKAYLQTGGITLSDKQAEMLAGYHGMLLDWNRRMDLTNVPPEEMALRHYADSLLPLAESGWFPKGAKLIDVGSGAGFPGLPIAILRPDMSVCLLDALKKRCDFLNAAAERLGVPHVRVVHARAEDAARGAHREGYDIAAARALAPLRVLAEYLLPFVKVGGRALCWKGPSLEAELSESAPALNLLGGQAGKAVLMPLPSVAHYVLPIEKAKATPGKYPRKAGTPARSPL